jgi:CRP-like cAMP-binding protein
LSIKDKGMLDASRLNSSSNRLLGFLSQSDRDLLGAHLKDVSLTLLQVLEEPNEPIEFIYFPESGMASVVADATIVEQLELGMIGKEGMTGLKVVLGNDRSPYQTFVQVAGSALRLSSDELRKAMEASRTMQKVMLRYVQVFMIQTSQTALANASAVLTQKLARWLLMSEDRLGTRHIPLTHEFLSIMLGVQRPGVTIALGELEGHGMIAAKRGLISILDRPSMLAITKGFYGVAESEYERRLTKLH